MIITIGNSTEFQPSECNAFENESKWSPNKRIHGYRFLLNVRTQADHDHAQNQFVGASATAEGDNRTYIITSAHMQRSSSTNGKFIDADFEVTIQEQDAKPSFSEIDINGLALQVLGYRVRRTDNSTIHTFLVNTTGVSFSELERKLDAEGDALSVQRFGVDDFPFMCRIGGANYWSRKEGPGTEESSRIINCVIDHETLRTREGFTSVVRSQNLERQVSVLGMQVKYLVRRLEGILNSEDLAVLRSAERLESGVGSIDWTGLEQIKNAREWFGAVEEAEETHTLN